jgi:hypothetical protein
LAGRRLAGISSKTDRIRTDVLTCDSRKRLYLPIKNKRFQGTDL